jgi:SsrA-binding protein
MEFGKNARAYFDYEILEEFEAGIVLLGFEVKAIRSGRFNLSGSHVIIRNGEAQLIGADIPPYQATNTPADYDSQRTRTLLLNKREILELMGKSDKTGLTIIPLRGIIKRGKVKIIIGLAKSRKKADKREYIKERDTRNEMRDAMRK